MMKSKIKLKNLFLFSWKKLWIIVVGGFVSIMLHNLISGFLGVEEPVFFLLVVVILPIYFLIMILYTIIYKIKNIK